MGMDERGLQSWRYLGNRLVKRRKWFCINMKGIMIQQQQKPELFSYFSFLFASFGYSYFFMTGSWLFISCLDGFRFIFSALVFNVSSISYKKSLITPLTGRAYFKTWDMVEASFILLPPFYNETVTFISFIFFSSRRYSKTLTIFVLASTYRMTSFTLAGVLLPSLPIIMTPTLYILYFNFIITFSSYFYNYKYGTKISSLCQPKPCFQLPKIIHRLS